jgi:hypothetical protein
MFDDESRYHALETAEWSPHDDRSTRDGRKIAYVRRRFLPQEDDAPLLGRVQVTEAQRRLDLIAARALGDPEQFWRICDTNGAMHPADLTGEVGRWLVVRMPGG